MRHTLQVELDHQHGHLHVHAPDLPEHLYGPLALGMAELAGFNVTVPMAKAHGEGPDPRYPELDELIDEIRRKWLAWAEWLVQQVTELWSSQSRTTPTAATLLDQKLRTHEAAVLADTTGFTADTDAIRSLVLRGELSPHYDTRAPVPRAFAMGTQEDFRTPRTVPGPGEHRTLSDRPLSDNELAAVAFVRERGGIYMRKPISSLRANMTRAAMELGIKTDARQLTKRELDAVRGTLTRSITDKASVAETARRLREVATAENLTNDMERVARTELAFAHNYGAYIALRGQVKANEDPEVYKIVSPMACEHCRRIWGEPSNPRIYKLSDVEAFDASGGNFGRPAKTWGPTIGPTHPNCFPDGVLVTTAHGDVPIERVGIGTLVLTHRGRWRRVTRTFRSKSADLVSVNGVPATGGHPFLTSRGWVAARDLVQGDELRQPSEIVSPTAHGQSHHAPTLLDEVRFLAAILGLFPRRRVPAPAIDLDRDPRLRKGEVHEEAPDLESWLRACAEPLQGLVERALQIGAEAAGVRCGHPAHHLLGLALAADGVVGSGRLTEPFLPRQLGGPHARGVARVPLLDPGAVQTEPNGIPRHTEPPGHLQHGEPHVRVQADHLGIVELKHQRSVAVHNLSVHDDESFVAEGLVVHNCTCPNLLLWDPLVHDAVEDVARELDAIYGGR